MAKKYPQPEEVGIIIPTDIKKDRYRKGFQHGLSGGQLDRVAYLRRSFRLGFRAAKLYLKEVRRCQGVVYFPVQGRIKMRSTY